MRTCMSTRSLSLRLHVRLRQPATDDKALLPRGFARWGGHDAYALRGVAKLGSTPPDPNAKGHAMPANTISFEGVHRFLRTLFAGDLHAKRVLSLAGATMGAITSASLAVALIGQGLALARGMETKQAVKQFDRLLSTQGIDVDAPLCHWVPFVVGQRPSITVGMDWTEFAANNQATIMLSLLSRPGRATPLFWLTVDTATLQNRRNGYEYQILVRFAAALPDGVQVCLVADRGFGDQKLYRRLTDELKFDFVIRFRGNITVTAADGEARAAAAWVGAGGR